jgi:Protein of unknown function (DUF2510)
MTFITSELERSVSAPIGAVNRSLQTALRDAGFTVASHSLTAIEARRGSKLACALVGGFALRKIPMAASAELAPAGERGCTVTVRLADAWSIAYGQASAVKSHYSRAFAEVQSALESALARLTPEVRGGDPVETSSKRSNAMLGGFAGWMGRTGDRVVDRGGALMTGEGLRRAKRPWDDVEQIRFESSRGSAVLGMLDVQAMIDVGAMIATRPGSMPPNLTAEVEHCLARLETTLAAAGGVVTLPLSDADVDVVAFLRQQARLRSELPVRTLEECTACHTRRVTNPDYRKIVKRNGFLKGIGGSFGAGLIRGHLTPFVLFNRVLGVAKLDPDFVCRTCQGMTADERLVTLCPRCGGVLASPVLSACPRCRHDLRNDLPRESLWRPAAAAAQPAPGTPAAWLADPTRRHRVRYWDGDDWTAHVADDGPATTDPIEGATR